MNHPLANLWNNGGIYEIILTHTGSKALKWWYESCCLADLIEQPAVLLKFIRAADYDNARSTAIPLDTAEMYEFCKWYKDAIICDPEFHKPDVVHKIYSLISPHC